jgi:hypothetical protein
LSRLPYIEMGEITMPRRKSIVAIRKIEQSILVIRGEKVILDTDLAELYGVSTKVLNQAVKRNKQRFPSDFMFQLSKKEKDEVVTICDHLNKLKFSRNLPYAFTEHGAIMAATVLNSKRAVEVSVYVVRTFVKLRLMLTSNRELARRLNQLEKKVGKHDEDIQTLITAIRRLMQPEASKKQRRIGFKN